MKAFFVLCATLSVIQVIFIGESTAQVYDYQDYTPYNNRLDRRTSIPQYDRQFTRQPSAASRRLESEINYERDGPLNRSLPRTRSAMREPQYSQISPRFNNNGNGKDYTEMQQQPIIRKRGNSLLGDILRMPADLVDNAGSLVGNKILNVHKIANHGITKLTDLGNGLTDSIMNTMDSGSKIYDSLGNVANGVLNTGAEIPRRLIKDSTGRLTNMLSFNNNNQYQDELANERRLAEEYIPYNNNVDEYYEPYAQQPASLPKRRLSMKGNEVENIPTRIKKLPSKLTSQKLPENVKQGQKLTPAQTPAIVQTENDELA